MYSIEGRFQRLGDDSCRLRDVHIGREAPEAEAKGMRRFAPERGQDNLHVLRDILGVPEADIRAMERKGVIKGLIPN